MSDTSDRPFGHDTLKFRAAFVPEAAKHKVLPGDIGRSLGYDAAKVAAVFVPEGGKPPGPSYVRIGNAQFRPDGADAASRVYSSRPTSQTAAAEPGQEETAPPPPPPVPALARGRTGLKQTGVSRAGLAAWRSVTRPESLRQALALRRAVNATKHAPSAASGQPPDAPQSD
jgi:hypothetical protein